MGPERQHLGMMTPPENKSSQNQTRDLNISKAKIGTIERKYFYTEAKLHFAYTSKNMTDNASVKN